MLLLLYILLLLIIESLLKRGYEVDHKTNKVIDRKLAILLIIFNSKKVFNEYVSDRSRFLYMTEELAAQLSKMVDQLPALFLIAVLPFLFAIVWIIKLPFWFIIKKNDRKFIAEFVENRDRNLIEA
ncbi:hypothetical protein [[Acholeplasma] multilocale]|uniref:hypothetical protein n=1 Tax=[Acholeplasma] multilocale TaxID=264638 RepID=UPI0012EB6F66|nr:hypothetical protein [[Acholeplasma] multilocale]